MKKYTKPKSKVMMKGSDIKKTKKVYAACGDCNQVGPGLSCDCQIEQHSIPV